MDLIVKSTLKTLEKSRVLLSNLTDDQLSNATVSPYYSSIGSHLRHILDFYDCVLNNNDKTVDLTARKRDIEAETICTSAICYLNSITDKLRQLDSTKNETISVIDDLGCGKMTIEYTFASLLAQANSHAIHHYAIISYILDRIGVQIEDEDFGYNPTSPKKSAAEA